MLDDLLLNSGNDIPFPVARLSIHQPTLKEIAYIGEQRFFQGCEVLKFSKENLPEKDKNNLINLTDFDVIMSMINDKAIDAQEMKFSVLMVLSLLFPDYKVVPKQNYISLTKEAEPDEEWRLDKNNFLQFQEILIEMCCLKQKGSQSYDPQGDLAKSIADKLRQRQQILNKNKPAQKINILDRYLSILAVGEQKDKQALLNYTIYQLFDEFERFQLKEQFYFHFKAQMAGAKNLKEVENWMKDIHT